MSRTKVSCPQALLRETAPFKITQHMTLPQVKASTKILSHSNDLIQIFSAKRSESIFIHFFS